MSYFPKSVSDFGINDTSLPMTRFADFMQQSLNINQAWQAEANLDQRYEAGDQSLWTQYYNAWQVRPGKQFAFNIIRPQISTLEGYQRAYRKNTVYTPLENGTQQTADDFTDIGIWLNQHQNLYEVMSTGFRQSLITGLSFVQMYMDFRRDPINGEICYVNRPYNSVICDPFWKNPDFSDCRGLVTRTYVTPLEAMSYLPEHAREIMQTNGFMPNEMSFQYMPENYQFMYNNLITYDEFYYPALRKQRLIVDSKSGETKEWRSDDDNRLRQFLKDFPTLKIWPSEVPTLRLSIVVQGKFAWDGPQPCGTDDWMITPIYAYLNPELEDQRLRWAGVVRSLRDTQFLFNHRKVLELQANEAVQNSGWLVEEDAVVNPMDLYNNQPGQIIYAKKGKLGNIMKTPISPIDPTWMQASQNMLDLSSKISNISETAMGQNTDAISGAHEQFKTATNLVANQRLFDQLDTAQKIIGRKTMNLIQNNWTPGKIKQILKRTPSREFYNKTFGKYDCQVELGYDTVTQKQMQFIQLLELEKLGIKIPRSALINAATIQNKTDLIKQMETEAQAEQQAQQKADQLAMLKLQAEIDMASAQAQVQRGFAMEKISEIQTNEAEAVERRALAIKNQQQGTLDMVKAAKEIDSISIDQLAKLIQLSKTIQDLQQLENEKLKAQEAEQKLASEERSRQIQQSQMQPQMNAQSPGNIPGLS